MIGDSLRARPFDPAGIVVAAVLLAAAAVVAWNASTLQDSSVYGVGPKAIPYAIATGLALLSVANLVMALTGQMPSRETGDPKAILLILGGLVALIALIALGGGFIPATAALFAATSTAFGRRAPLTDLAIGAALGLLIFLVFDKALTLALPEGPIERLF
jgi:putative tricarboxylic transport membrane protein